LARALSRVRKQAIADTAPQLVRMFTAIGICLPGNTPLMPLEHPLASVLPR
jgi:hypothetical protein